MAWRIVLTGLLLIGSDQVGAEEFTKHLGVWSERSDLTLKSIEASPLSEQEKQHHRERLQLAGGFTSSLIFRSDVVASFAGEEVPDNPAYFPYALELLAPDLVRITMKDPHRNREAERFLRFDGDCFYPVERPDAEPTFKSYYCRQETGEAEDGANKGVERDGPPGPSRTPRVSRSPGDHS